MIPWLNRELVALMPGWNASVIPEILEQMRDYLLDHDIKSENTKNYFLRYLHANTSHFLHEFHNYAVSPYDMVGYDRIVEYNGRPLNSHAALSDAGVITVSSSDSSSSSDSEDIRVVDEERSTEVTIEADNCMVVTSIANGGGISNNDALNDIGGSNHATGGSLYRNTNELSTPIATGNVSVSSDDSDSEVEFVLARKPPHLRTPEQVTLDSASDSDVIYIANSPNEPAVIDSSDSSDNQPLSKTMKRLKSEHNDPMINEQKPTTEEPMLDMPSLAVPLETFNIYNFGASTSNSFKNMHPKKMYCKPNRKRSIGKSIYEKSSSETSGSSSDNDGDWYVNSANNSNSKKKVSKKAKKSTKSSKKRKDSERKHKKRRTESSSNVVPLAELISTELRNDKEEPDIADVAEEIVVVSNIEDPVIPSESSNVIVPVNDAAKPKIKSVVIRKSGNQQHYIEQPNQSSSSSTTSNSNTEENDFRLFIDD